MVFQGYRRLTPVFAVLFLLQACVNAGRESVLDPNVVGSNPELQKLVGKSVELRGQLNVGMQADVLNHNGEGIYLNPDGNTGFGPNYGSIVSAMGILRFRHFDPCPPKVKCWQMPPDYYYLDGKITIKPDKK